MTPWDALAELYRKELNAGLQIDWDGGIVAWIGGPILSEHSALPDDDLYASRVPLGMNHIGNPIRASEVFESHEFDQIAPWLLTEARRLYPKSFEDDVRIPPMSAGDSG